MALHARGSVVGVPWKFAVCRLDDGLNRARVVEGTDGVGSPRKVRWKKLRVVFKRYGKAFQAGSGGVMASAEEW